MSLWGDVAGTALGGVNGGLLAHYWDDINSTPSVNGIPAKKKPMTASDVKISPDLSGALGDVGTAAYNTIGSNYGAAKKRLAGEAGTLGMSPNSNSYAAERLPATQALDIGNLESALGGGVGNTAYNDTLAQRDYNQKAQLAEEAAQLNKPSLLEQIFSGIGAVGKPTATYYGMKNKGFGGGGYPSMASYPSYDMMDLG